MDVTLKSPKEKVQRAKISMMWFAMGSMLMTFAGLTSAYIVSKSRVDWSTQYEFPVAFFYSLGVILASSLCFYLGKSFVKKDQQKTATPFFVSSLLLGGLFAYLQVVGFEQIIAQGFFPTGSSSTVITSFVYIIVFFHLVHVIAGLLVQIVVLVNHLRGRYSKDRILGLQLAGMFWHFVDILWVYLFCFLYFIR